jgi:hypothetical protein
MGSSAVDSRILLERVERYFSTGHPRDRVSLTTGPLMQAEQLLAEADKDVAVVSHELSIWRLDIHSLSETEATVAFVAEAVSVTKPAVEQRSAQSINEEHYGRRVLYTGPVSLVKVRGDWKLIDYHVDGRSILNNVWVRPSGEGSALGTTFNAEAATFTSLTKVYLRVRNGLDSAAHLCDASLEFPGLWKRGKVPAEYRRPEEIRAGGQRLVHFAFDRKPFREAPALVTLYFVLRRGNDEQEVSLTVSKEKSRG